MTKSLRIGACEPRCLTARCLLWRRSRVGGLTTRTTAKAIKVELVGLRQIWVHESWQFEGVPAGHTELSWEWIEGVLVVVL